MLSRRSLLAGFAATLASCGAPAFARSRATWKDQRQVGPFLVSAAFDLSPHGAMLAELEVLQAELQRILALRPSSQSIEVLLLASAADHQTYLAERYPAAPYRRALFVEQGARLSVIAYDQPELAVDLRHEATHALLHSDVPRLPLWLDEGLAEYFEPAGAERVFDSPHLSPLRWDLRLGRLISLRQLEHKYALESLSERDYRFAWAWTHFLLHGPEYAAEALWQNLAAWRTGEPGRLFSKLLAAAPSYQSEFVAHFRHWRRPAELASR